MKLQHVSVILESAPSTFDNLPEPQTVDEKGDATIRRYEMLAHACRALYDTMSDVEDKLTEQYPSYIGRYTSNVILKQKHAAGRTKPVLTNSGTYVIANDAPAAVKAAVERIRKMEARRDQLQAVRDQIENAKRRHESQQRKKEKEQKLATAATAAWAKAPQITIPAAKVPAKVSTGAGMATNPYHGAGNTDQYAGSPLHYSWTAQMKPNFVEIQNALERNGIAPLDRIYAARYQGGPTNFICIGAGGRLVWRKYDVGGGSGQNWIFVDGVKMNASALTGNPPAVQDQILQPLKPNTTGNTP